MNFFKKVANIFVETEEGAGTADSSKESAASAPTDVEALLASLNNDAPTENGIETTLSVDATSIPTIATATTTEGAEITSFTEEVDFPTLYEQGGIPTVTKPPEDLIAFWNKLSVDWTAQKKIHVIEAMAATDDSWSLTETASNAQEKILFLQESIKLDAANLEAKKASIQLKKEQLDKDYAEFKSEVRLQIEALQNQLSEFSSATEENKNALDEEALEAQRAASGRQKNFEKMIDELSILKHFEKDTTDTETVSE